MDIRQLRYFLGVLEAKSLTKAAGSLHVAQPALGLQIRNLEHELGVQLLVRHARGIAPTEAGELLARHATLLVRQFNRAQQELMDYGKGPRGRIELGLTSTAAQVVVATLVERCRREFPDVQLVITEGRSKRLTEMVADDEIDLALTFHPGSGAELASMPLIEETLMLVRARRRGKLPHEIDIRSVLEHELILPSRPHLVREMVEAAAKAQGMEIRLYCNVDSVMTMKELARRGLAPTVLPLGAVHKEVEGGELQVQHITNANLRRTLYLIYSTARPPSKTRDAVRLEVQKVARAFARRGSMGWTPPHAAGDST